MRTFDQTPPTVTPDPHAPPAWMTGRLVVALERLPQAAYVWDDDDPDVVWENSVDCTDVLAEPFNNTTAWTATSISIVAGRNGTCARTNANGDTCFYTIPSANESDTITIGFAYRTSFLSLDNQVCRIVSDARATDHLSFSLEVSGNIRVWRGAPGGTSLGVTSGVTLVANTWYYIEIQAKLHDTAGFVTVRIDGTNRLALTNIDTKNAGTKTVFDGFRLSGVSGANQDFDDLYLSTGTQCTFKGDHAISLAVEPAVEPGEQLVWDAPFIGSGFTDVWCDMTNLGIVHGAPDAADIYAMSACQLELRDPGDGRYRSRTPDGSLVYYAPGRRLSIWWQDPGGVKWWLFNGILATWRERFDNTVAIEAYSGQNLGRPPGVSWQPGADPQVLSARVAAILSAAGYTGVSRCDTGDIALSLAPEGDTAPLDLIRQAAWSDGGVVYTDADDTLVTRSRRWREGRGDQGTIPVFTDNVCQTGPGGIVVWEPQAADDDLRLAGTVRLENVADPPLVSTAVNIGLDPSIRFTHPGPDLWKLQGDGDVLAAHIAAQRAVARLAIGTANLYLHDTRFDYWATALNLRLGDQIRFVHEDTYTTAVSTFDIVAVVTTIAHNINPDSWVMSFGTSPTVSYVPIEEWDNAAFYWDDTLAQAVWR